MPDDLIPIEDKLRPGEILDPASHLIMRGWPVTADGILANADRTRVRYSLAGEPFVAISAEATIAGWDVDTILMGARLRSRSSYAISPVGDLIAAGFDLAPTFQAPHYSVLLPSYTQEAAARLVEVFGEVKLNPYSRRRDP